MPDVYEAAVKAANAAGHARVCAHAAIRKLRMNRPLTRADLAELERMLTESGVGGVPDG